MNRRLKLTTIFFIMMFIIIFTPKFVLAEDGQKYIDGLGPTQTEKKNTDGNRTYSQKTTTIAKTIFDHMKNETTMAEYFSKHEATNQFAGSTIQMAYRQTLQNTEVAYCVNKGAHINSQHRWLYHVYGYIEVGESAVFVYRYKNGGGYTKTSYTDDETIQLARYLAAAVSINGPFGGYTESGTSADGNAGVTTYKQLSELGYGSQDNYNDSQLMVYYYWNQSKLLVNLGISDWQHKQDNEYSDLQVKMDSVRADFEEKVDLDGKVYTAQMIYVSGYSLEDTSTPKKYMKFKTDGQNQKK